MAAAQRGNSAGLIARLRAQPWRFRFFQAVRLLALGARRAGLPLRDSLPPGLRFTTVANLGFPASEVVALEPRAAGHERDEPQDNDGLSLRVAFLGLTGPSAALAMPYTELLVQRRHHHRDETLHAFLDIFSHRAVALFYNAGRKYRFHAPIELGEEDGFSSNLLDLVGAGPSGLRGRLERQGAGVPDRFLMYYAGLLAQKPVSGTALAQLVSGFFKVGAELEAFVGTWMELPPGEQTRIGMGACVLGQTALAGARQYDRQTKIGLRLGPLSARRFDEFLPGRPGALALAELVRFCVGHSLAVDVTLVLERDAVPPARLSTDSESPLRLGYNAWPRTRPLDADRSDTRYALQA